MNGAERAIEAAKQEARSLASAEERKLWTSVYIATFRSNSPPQSVAGITQDAVMAADRAVQAFKERYNPEQ